MPELKIYTGPMHGGKTTRLLAQLERYVYQKKKVQLFKPAIDDRFSVESVVTHSGREWEAFRVNSAKEIIINSTHAQVVAVDEMFMIPNAAEALLQLYASGKTILVSTLQLSYEPQPFDEVLKLMPWATSIDICPAVCAQCDKDAYYTRRLAGGDEKIQIGGSESYEPLCFEHYTELKEKFFGGRKHVKV